MKRAGPILLFLVVIIVILIAVTFLVVGGGGGLLNLGGSKPTATPANVKIYVVGQPINRNDEIKAESLSTIELPLNLVHEWMIRDPAKVVKKYAVYALKQGHLLSLDDVSESPGALGSETSRQIKPGLVAISIPINRLSAVAYGIRDNDFVNVIATTLFADIDASFQTILPNAFGQIVNTGIKPNEAPLVTLGQNNAGDNGTGLSRSAGRAELDPTLNQAIYFIPSETQRPRLVSQMVLQFIQVLHVGTFSTPNQVTVQPTPEAAAAKGGEVAPTVVPLASKPDIITLMVTPQDAVSLTYLLYSGAKLTLTLRAPDDESRAETEAATLQYLLSQYAIPVPAKLPYGIQPRIDTLVEPVLLNDVPTPRP
jgi:Flp pilus assembly protein CpaB